MHWQIFWSMTRSELTSLASRSTRIACRLHQGIRAIGKRTPPVTPTVFQDDRIAQLFESLGAHDRCHLIAAFLASKRVSDDKDLHLAALLHDIGKVTLSGKPISLAARAFAVLASACPRWMRRTWGTDPDGAWLTGPWLAAHHARIGAERLRALGLNDAISRLVEQHDDSDACDVRLRLLREIDSATL
jgi:hypothetical protein